KTKENEEQDESAQHEFQHVIARMSEPALSPGAAYWNANHNQQRRENCEHEQKPPHKEPEAGLLAPGPSRADMTFPSHDAIEQDESHHAADVREQHKQHNSHHNEGCDQPGE